MGNTIAFQVPLWTKQRNNLFVSSKVSLTQSPICETSSSSGRETLFYIFLSCAVEKNLCRYCHHWRFPFTKLPHWLIHMQTSGRVVLCRKVWIWHLSWSQRYWRSLVSYQPTPPHTPKGTASQGQRGPCGGLCQLLERSHCWFSGQMQNIPYTSMGNLPKHIPSAHLYMQDKILLLVPFYSH